jgi:hypothetical protein
MKPERPARSSPRIAACSVQFTVSGEPAGMGYCPLEITIRSLLKWLPNKWNSLPCHSRPSSPTRIRSGTRLLLFRAARLRASLARRSLCRVRSRCLTRIIKEEKESHRPPAGRPRPIITAETTERSRRAHQSSILFSPRSTRKPQAMASINFSAEHSLPSRGAMQSNQHPVKEPEEDSSGWAGRPQAARCAFMRLISPGFRSPRAILRS